VLIWPMIAADQQMAVTNNFSIFPRDDVWATFCGSFAIVEAVIRLCAPGMSLVTFPPRLTC